jgi:hypothetical protein
VEAITTQKTPQKNKGENMKEKTILKERFYKLFEGCELFAIQLNGFTHKIYFKDENKRRKIGIYCPSAAAQKIGDTVEQDTPRINKLFNGFATWQYQGNAKELIYKDVEEF